ncbi:hypothetical protein [Herminiimonas fonticola]|uniref:hypothetical protein n=1 Tax=Herminiimonas fonticola TaxID=303380 RepID=UPI003BABF889
MTEKDIKAINLDTATSQAALTTKDVEAVFGGYELLKLRDKDIARIVYSSKNDSPIFTRQTHVLVTENFEKKYPAATQRLVNTLLRTAKWGADEANREEVFNLWAHTGTLTLANWKEDFSGEPLRIRLSPLFDSFLTARYKDAVDQAVKFKLTRKRFDVDQWIDRSYLNTALKEMKLENYWPVTQADGK